jgi:protein tyrosine phosphatase (PTP) superfamily phosphohydrolase (DUF442 family)
VEARRRWPVSRDEAPSLRRVRVRWSGSVLSHCREGTRTRQVLPATMYAMSANRWGQVKSSRSIWSRRNTDQIPIHRSAF